MRALILTAALALLGGGASAQAPAANDRPAPPLIEAPKERVGTDIRRTTIIVRDIEKSLQLYRDVMGLKVNYDEEMTVSSVAFTQGGKPRPIRLVLLNANDPRIGWIGLLQYTDNRRTRSVSQRHLGLGSHIIVTQVDDAKTKCAAAEKLPNVRMVNPLKETSYPGRDGAPPIIVLGCQFFDADGAYLEFNQSIR
jgi:catechol 2,3-dioxygenase-like lactoylglutathione lyase family enzyme